MAYGYMGRTTIDVLASIAAVMFVILLVAGFMGPRQLLSRTHDEMRVDGVRNIMEAILEMQTVDPDAVDRLREAYEDAGAPPRVMLGSAVLCAGDWGVQCGDEILADECLDAERYGLTSYIPKMPVDGGWEEYSLQQTGYYLSFQPGSLEVGACAPETRNDIRLTRTFY